MLHLQKHSIFKQSFSIANLLERNTQMRSRDRGQAEAGTGWDPVGFYKAKELQMM